MTVSVTASPNNAEPTAVPPLPAFVTAGEYEAFDVTFGNPAAYRTPWRTSYVVPEPSSSTRTGMIAAFQSTHDKFRAYHADCRRLARSATSDARALDELRRVLDDYANLFREHHQAEDIYFFPALRRAEPALDPIVDELAGQHEQLAAQLAVVLERAHRVHAGATERNRVVLLVDGLVEVIGGVDEHLQYEETNTIPVVRTWTSWPV